jgi:hypothetical protein
VKRTKGAAASPGPRPVPAAPEPRWRRHLVWACVAAAYFTIFPYFRALENPNENVRIWATRALVAHGTWDITEVVTAWGPVTDTAARDGHRYSSKAPGTSLLGVPVHFVHDRAARLLLGHEPSLPATTWVLRIFTVVAPLLAFLWWFARRVERETRSPFARDLLTLGLGLGTMFYPYGLAFIGHIQSAALAFAGFLLLTPVGGEPASSELPSRRRLALAGSLVGLSVCFEYQTLLAAAVIAAAAALSLRRRIGWFLLGALGPALLLALYHASLFGHAWELPYAHLDDPGYAVYHHSRGFLGLGQPRARVLGSGFFSVDYGLFVYSPLLAVGLALGLWAAIGRGDRVCGVAVGVTAVMAVFLSGMTNWRAGWCAAGPRYIAVVVPFLVFAIARTWHDRVAPRPWLQALLLATTILSVALCGLSGLFPHFPVQLDNPIFDLVVPLLRGGYVPHGLGTALGLHGAVALLPWAAAVIGALVVVVLAARQELGWSRTGAGIAIALVALGGLSLLGRDTREDARVRRFIEGIWEPKPAGSAGPAAGGIDHGPA